jgi:hypothetical protein
MISMSARTYRVTAPDEAMIAGVETPSTAAQASERSQASLTAMLDRLREHGGTSDS